MSTIGKVFIVLNLIMAGVFLGYASTSLATSQEYRLRYEQEVDDHQATVEEKDGEISRLDEQLTASQSTASQLRADLQTSKAEFTRAESDLREARTQIDKLDSSYQQMAATFTTLDDRLGQIEQAKDDAVAARVQAEQERDDAVDEKDSAIQAQRDAEDVARTRASQITDLEVARTDLQLEVERKGTELAMLQQKTGARLDDIIAPPPIEAAVLGVDYGVEPGLVALNVGKNHKVQRGFVFDVFAGEVYKGQVKVENVRENMCSCLVITPAVGTVIRQGDTATTTL